MEAPLVADGAVQKARFLGSFCMKVITLPRQARDEHRKI